MEETFLSGAEFDTPVFEGKPRSTYMICSTPRCGSTLLCSLLTNTGGMGVPHEYFHLKEHGQFLLKRLMPDPQRQVSIVEYFDTLVRYRTTANGVFGIKAHINQCLPYYQNGFISHFFGELKHVAILRRDVLGQAISGVIASQTGKWTSKEKATKQPEFSPDAIEGAVKAVVFQNHLWQHFFQVNDIEPCVIYYEDLLAEPTREIQRVLDFVGVDTQVSVAIENAGISREATALNEEWRERFNAALKIKR